MFLYIKTNILRGYGIFKNDFAHPREPATVLRVPAALWRGVEGSEGRAGAGAAGLAQRWVPDVGG